LENTASIPCWFFDIAAIEALGLCRCQRLWITGICQRGYLVGATGSIEPC
jgi:hypothetical protein